MKDNKKPAKPANKLKMDLKKVPLSKERKKEMSLNISDQQFIKRLFDMQDVVLECYINKVYDNHSILIYSTLNKIMEEQNLRIFNMLEKQNILLEEVKEDIKKINDELNDLRTKHEENKSRIDKIEKVLNL